MRYRLTGHASDRRRQILLLKRRRQVWCRYLDLWAFLPGRHHLRFHGTVNRLFGCLQTKGTAYSAAIGFQAFRDLPVLGNHAHPCAMLLPDRRAFWRIRQRRVQR